MLARSKAGWVSGMLVLLVAGAGFAGPTNDWKVTSGAWDADGSWTLNHKPLAHELARFPYVAPHNEIRTVTLTTSETVDEVLSNSQSGNNICSYSWVGTGSLTVSNNFRITYNSHDVYIQPTLDLGGRFEITEIWNPPGSIKFGDASTYTSGNTFNGGFYNYGKMLYLGGTTTFGGILRVRSTRLVSFNANSTGVTKIEGGSSVFLPDTTFEMLYGGTLWFPSATDFSNVGTLTFNGGMLRLDATSGYTFPTYANGFEVKRGMLGIAGNGTLGPDANGLRLGDTGSFGWLVGSAANSAGNYITRPIILAGNGGFIWASALYRDADMNVATDISGPGMLIKTGEKTLFLRNAGNGTASSYSGGTVVAGGTLTPESSRTLGSGNVTVGPGGLLNLAKADQIDSGASVRVDGDLYGPGKLLLLSNQEFPPIDTNSTGTIAMDVNNSHALASIGSAFLGATANSAAYGASSLPVGAGNTYRIGGILDPLGTGASYTQRVTFDVNGGDNGAGVLTGPNDLLIAYGGAVLQDLNTYTGTTTVRNNLKYDTWESASLRIDFQTGGSPLGSPTAAVNLFNGILVFANLNNGAAIAKGDLNIHGRSFLWLDCSANNYTSIVTFATLNRVNRSHLTMYGSQNKLGDRERFIVTSAPALNNGIVDPWMISDYSGKTPEFLTYGVNGFARAGFNATVPAGAFPTDGTKVVQVTAATALASDPDVYALRIDDTVTGAANTITVRSGGLILQNAKTHTANFKFGAAGDVEAVIYTTYNHNITVSGTLTTTNGLTKAGPGRLTLNANNASSLSGKITVTGGTLWANTDAALGAAANVICLNGGELSGNADIDHHITVGPAGGFLRRAVKKNIGDETPGTPGGPLVVNANIGLGWYAHTFTGPMIINGNVRIDGSGTPGRGPVTILPGRILTFYTTSGGINSTGRYTLHAGNNVGSLVLDFSGSSTAPLVHKIGSLAGSGNVLFGNTQTLPSGSALIVGNDNTSCDYYGRIMQFYPLYSRSYKVIKEGTGTWTLWGDSLWQGPLIVSNGTLQVNGAIDRVSSVTVCDGATLGGRGTLNAPVTVDAGGTLAGSLNFGGNVTLDPGAAYTVTLGGTTAVTEFGQATLNSGTLNFNGCSLKVDLLAAPAVGDTFKIVNNVGGTISGTPFAEGSKITAAFGGETFSFQVAYAGDGVTLTALPRGTIIVIR